MNDTLERIACALERIAEHCERQPRPQTDSRLWTTTEAADYLGCSEDHIYNLRARGDLRAVKVGIAWRFTPESVKAYGKQPGPVGVVRQIRGNR